MNGPPLTPAQAGSLRRTLVLWLSAGLVLGLAIGSVFLYRQAREEANELFDYQLRQVALSLPSQAFSPLAPSRPDDVDLAEDVVIQIWDRTGLRLYYSHGQSILPQRAQLGFSDVVASGGTWRVYSAPLGDTIVQVAQPMTGRRNLAARMALRTVAPMLAMMPLLGLLVWVAVGRSLAPLRRMAAEVEARDARSLAPVSEQGLPAEVLPLTHALNDLLGRLGAALDAQRAFVADAAHELRSPLTALKLQVRLAERARDDAERAAAFADLGQGLERAIRLVQQLLTLARQEPGAFEPARAPVDLAALAREAVAEFASLARHRDVALEPPAGAEGEVIVDGDRESLRILLANLIDNALRYTPGGGRVDVQAVRDAQGACVIVRDTGPGVPQADLARVFDRFYRVPGTDTADGTRGSGLGLAIVRRIAEVHGARVTLANARPGLLAEVRFPARTPAPG